MWFRCFLYCLFALASFFVGSGVGEYVPDSVKNIVTKDGLNNLLTILASSMLAVTTFSLSIMVQAFSAAATTATPRANKLLMEDSTAQNALGTFIGAFLFSIVGIIGINSNFYDQNIVVVLFVFTIIMILVIVVMLLKWIDQLSRLGRVTETIDLVDKALEQALKKRGENPFMGANKLAQDFNSLQNSLHPVIADEIGYVQFIDVEMLENLACKHGVKIYVAVNPGKFLDGTTSLAFIDKEFDDDTRRCVLEAIVVGGNRTFDQDPRYGFILLSEIALRALSPAINDPGTAIDIIGSYIRGVMLWQTISKKHEEVLEDREIKYPHVYIPSIIEKDIFEDMYAGLIPAASEHITVSIRLKKSLLTFKTLKNKNLSDNADSWLTYLESLCEEKLHRSDFEKIKSVK